MPTPARAARRAPILLAALLASASLAAGPAASVRAAAPVDLFFSEYVEGTSNNKALEIYNGTGLAVDLASGGYNVQVLFNGATSAGLTISLTGTVATGDVFVLAQSLSAAAILAQADQVNGSGWFNGDDTVLLRKGAAVIDSIGQAGVDPGTEWGSGLLSTADNTLRRAVAVCAGDAVASDAFDPATGWEGFATDTFGGLGSHTADCGAPAETAPVVTGTVPADGATDVQPAASISITFNEPVNVAGSWFTLACNRSGVHSASVTGGPTTFTVNPDTDFVAGETCTFTVAADAVRDQDGNDPPDAMAVDFTIGFSTRDVCIEPYTPIPAIQGSGATAAITGSVSTTGIVVGDYEGPSPALRGFFIQDPGDGNPATSDGIFVFEGSNADAVSLGDIVRVTGNAGENQGQTQVSASSITRCGTGNLAPVDVTFPLASPDTLEAFEGMLVRLPQTMTVTEHFQLGRFGQVLLSQGGRLAAPTAVAAPGAPAADVAAANDLRSVIVDDGSQAQNPDPIVFGRGGQPLSASNTLRGGDTALNVTGVLTYTWAGNAASGNAYRIRPVNALHGAATFTAANARPGGGPAVGGTLRVAGLNLLNFFNSFGGCTAGVGGAATDCRGANSQAELDRQWPKTVAAILALDADVVGINEIENDGYGPASAIAFLVDRLNAATAPGTWAYVDADAGTGRVNALGLDAIKVGLLYRPAAVTPTGSTAALDTTAFVNGGDSAPRNRASLAQAFREDATGAVFIAGINHLKSKGSACDAPDAGDGQGNCNAVRVAAVQELTAWLASDPTGTGDPDVLLLGDYNSYAREDPVAALEVAGYRNLVDAHIGADAYSYVFDAGWGYLDYAFASPSLAQAVTGVAEHHINADEPSVVDYQVEFKSAGQLVSLYAPDQFRMSDHDPLVVGLRLNGAPTVDANGPYSVDEGGSVELAATGTDPDGDHLTYTWDLDEDGSFETDGRKVDLPAAGLDGPATLHVRVRASDPSGASDTARATVTVANVAPSVTASFDSTPIACGPDNATLTLAISDPGAADTQTAVVDWGDGSNPETVDPAGAEVALVHGYAAAGAYLATVTVTDDDGGVGTASATAVVGLTATVDRPLEADGSSVFRHGSTIPVKVTLVACDGSVPEDLAPLIALTKLAGATPAAEISGPPATDAADTLGVMRFADGQYLYNLATKPLPDPRGSYRIQVTVPLTGQVIEVGFSLRR